MRHPVRRLLPTALAGALLVVPLAACSARVAPAATIDGDEVSDSELRDEVEIWARNPEFLQQIGITDAGVPGARPQALVQAVLSIRIQGEVIGQALEDAGQEVSSEDLDAFNDQFGSLFAGFEDEALADRLARTFVAFQLAQQSGVQPSADVFDVEISSRYGSWDERRLTVVGPEGPVELDELEPEDGLVADEGAEG